MSNKPIRSSSDGASPRNNAVQGASVDPTIHARHGDMVEAAQNLEVQEYLVNKLQFFKKKNRAVQLGGFVPDYILVDEELQVPYLKRFDAVVFLTDISGFTKLTEEYTLKGKGGTDQLTKTLASYMGPLAECILRIGGDIIKFAGDAFLSVWEVKQFEEFPQLVQKVVDCGLYCQEKYGSYLTDVGTIIKVKIGIGAGTCYAAGLGNKVYHHYVIYGPGVKAASGAEKNCQSGQVLLHPSAWKFCEPKQFAFTEVAEGYTKVTDIIQFINPANRGRPIVAQRLKNKNQADSSVSYSDSIRPTLDQNITTLAEERLRKYVIPPVLKKLDDEIPLEYLNESRMVSIVFIHVDVKPIELDEEYGELQAEVVQSAFLTILRAATTLNGCLTKVIMFDKGLTYLVVFGLPGFIQDNQTANALNFAYRMKPVLNTIPNVAEVSIGVTTGSTYCGVIGHPRRHEYTVIGRKVNKAARLMCYYPGKVTCGQEAFYNSKLPAHYFQLLDINRDLPGILNVGKIYEYISSADGDANGVRKYEFPMLGRKTEMGLIMKLMDSCRVDFENNLAMTRLSRTMYDPKSATNVTSSGTWMVIIEGENGIGKSRLLSAAMVETEKLGWTVYSVVLSLQHASLNFFAVTNLMIQALNMEGLRLPSEREEHLRKVAIASGVPDIIQDLCTLNELLHLRLPTPQKFAYADVRARHSFAQHTLIQLLKIYHPSSMILLCVEDAHYMQQTSWEYLNFISRLPSIVTIMTLRRNPDGLPKIPDVAYKICYHSAHVKPIRIPVLESKYLLPLACQIMEVKAIPTDLEKIIATKSMGNPSWVENILHELLNAEKIKIIETDGGPVKLPKNMKLSYVNHQYITRQNALQKTIKVMVPLDTLSGSSDGEDSDVGSVRSDSPKRMRVNPEKRFCVVKSNTNITSDAVYGSLNEMILDTFDALNTNEQMMIKCACILGGRFSHTMLNRILPFYGRDAKKYLLSFQRLMEDRIICCASKTKRNTSYRSRIKNKKIGVAPEPIECYCNQSENGGNAYLEDYQHDPSMLQLPNYCYCSYAEFTKYDMVGVVYKLMTEDLKRELHLKAAKYLETTAIQCVSCRGQNSTFTYGFDLKSMDLGAEDEEAIIAGANKQRKRTTKAKRAPNAETSAKSISVSMKRRPKSLVLDDDDDSVKGGSILERSIKKKKHRIKGSLATRIHGLRRTLGSGGGQVASIELDILKSLLEFHRMNKKVRRCQCLGKKSVDDDPNASTSSSNESLPPLHITAAATAAGATAPLNPEIFKKDETKLPLSVNNGGGGGGGSGGGSSAGGDTPTGARSPNNQQRKISFSGVDMVKKFNGDGELEEIVEKKSTALDTDDSDEENPVDLDYDLRDCQCAVIQARICTELIKHYREAGKFGKCLVNMLDAAEAEITIGNSAQALVHLEKALEILDGFNSNEYATPNLDDPDDIVPVDKEIHTQMNFLSGLAYFETGVVVKAKGFFIDCLKLLGAILPMEGHHRKVQLAIKAAGYSLWRRNNVCCPSTIHILRKKQQRDKKGTVIGMKIRTLSYLQKVYKMENNVNMALLVSLLQVCLAEELGGYMHDEIPAYCSMMEMWAHVGKHQKAQFYEKKSLEIVRENLGSEEQVDPLGLLTSANLFLTLATVRLSRGELKSATEASYLSLRIANVLHDNTLSIHLYPVLIRTLIFTLQISEIMVAMQQLWYTSQVEDNWVGMATYFNLSLDLIIELCCPLESFYYCEQFVTGKDWNDDVALFREFEIQYSFECSLALWNARYSKWDEAKVWVTRAESHVPKTVSMRSVGGTLKLLQLYLISANFHQTKQCFQLCANDLSRAKKLFKELKQDIKILPAYQPRYCHMMAYYWKIRERKNLTNRQLDKATQIARRLGNQLEEEFVKHSRLVWSSSSSGVGASSIEYFWLENSDKKNSVDWHVSGKIPWANIMYSLPVSKWK